MSKQKTRLWLRIGRIIIGIAIFIILYLKLGFKATFGSISTIGILPIIIFAILFFIYTALESVCLKIIIDSLGKKVKFKKIVQYYLMSWAVGQFTPGNLGEFSIIFFLNKEKHMNLGKTSAISIADKIITFALIFIIGGFAMFFYLPFQQALTLALIIAIIGTLLLLLALNTKVRNIITKRIFRKSHKTVDLFDKDIKTFFFKRKKQVALNFGVTAIRWLILFIGVKILFDALGVRVSLGHVIGIISLSTLVSLIPVSVSGLGIRETSGVYLFKAVGISTIASGTIFGVMLIIRYILAVIIFLVNKVGPEVFVKDAMFIKK
ncbi:hypothetical protein AYK26_02275 [Euryarchaeota archaeon SM23-78]|nr:MAG: hypothetical protein AYK26_02275 [Euryarchaeota archaeon SM23-78]MBW3001246.1 flippase-like domain-containing protein [Candidatus Woesearchaeota archaeon]